MSEIVGPAAAALASLCPDDVIFLQSLPKAELHAHLNGYIPIKTILELAQKYSPSSSQTTEVADIIEKLKSGVVLNDLFDFFSLMPAIYTLTSTLEAVVTTTCAVLQLFLNPTSDATESPQCTYLELRTTPRTTTHMTRERYLTVVLDEVEMYPATRATLIVSVDRCTSDSDLEEYISLALEMKNRGRRVGAIDVCGDPRGGDMQSFTQHLSRAKGASLGLTVHIAESTNNTTEDSLAFLSCRPDRLGHATSLSDELKTLFFEDIPQPGTECGPLSEFGLRDPLHPLHSKFQDLKEGYFLRFVSDSTESEEAKVQMSFRADAEKFSERAAIKDIEEMIKQAESPNNARVNGQYKSCIEICLSSNLLCKTVASLDAHHIRYYLKNDHPIAICTDDALLFRMSCLREYFLLLAQPPLGLGLSRDDVARIAQMGMDAAFLRPRD
ncbi:Metallo-dependent hydrolase [Suillus plorans]|uniref:Metallo-dependent hydrolase n=1 Tax=Suillus plorans TaxID=116603 RepID=A0A9P7DAZ3_9AGAM|nr:Metallo-dependent hydrolase [Suillus plorans]KAG1786713.1 Metallo-dependent hydrolase [Suillus plorans]